MRVIKRYAGLLRDMVSAGYLEESDVGGWVRAEDYDALQAAMSALLQAIAAEPAPSLERSEPGGYDAPKLRGSRESE